MAESSGDDWPRTGTRRDNRGRKPMERRKFVVGLGSLAAGGAAVTGTGAVSQFNSGDRDISAEVVGDASAYVALTKYDNGQGNPDEGKSDPSGSDGQTRHGNFVTFSGSPAKLSLDFSKQSSARSGNPQSGNTLGGTGLNPGSTYYFDEVFQVLNLSNNSGNAVGELEAWISESIPGILFYKGSSNGSRTVLDGSSQSNKLSMSPGQAEAVGVKIVADDLASNNVTDQFQVIAQNPNNGL